MKKFVALFAVVAATCASAAWAATPQGKLTGGAFPNIDALHIHGVFISTTVLDGETAYVAKKNDRSGDCDGDSGSVQVRYNDNSSATYAITCAHFSGTRKISIAWFDTKLNEYVLYRVQDQRGGDDVLWGTTTNLATLIGWVNVGHVVLTHTTAGDGDYVVTP
jgi:hypothetical protein